MPFPPDLPEKVRVVALHLGIVSEDIEEYFVRGSGPGGQRKNKRSTCVELNHVPTGIRVRVQEERDQHRNRMRAYEILIARVQELRKDREETEKKEVFRERRRHARRTRSVQEGVLQEKKKRGTVKALRRKALSESLHPEER